MTPPTSGSRRCERTYARRLGLWRPVSTPWPPKLIDKPSEPTHVSCKHAKRWRGARKDELAAKLRLTEITKDLEHIDALVRAADDDAAAAREAGWLDEGVYLASSDRYENQILPCRFPSGSPEEALDCACGRYRDNAT